MLKHILSPLFIKLYASIIGVLFVSVILIQGIFIYEDHSTQYIDFVNKTKIPAQFITQLFIEGDQQYKTIIPLLEKMSLQSIVIHNSSSLNLALENSIIEKTIDNINIYQHKIDGRLFAVFNLDVNTFLLVSDFNDDLSMDNIPLNIRLVLENENTQNNYFQFIITTVSILFFVLIACILLIYIRSISKHILKLTHASQSFAQGDRKVRIQTDLPAPMNELAISFNHLAQELESTLDEQQIMSNALSHELRTPLTRLKLAVSLVKNKCTDQQVLPLICSIDEYVDDLDQLTNHILTIAKLQHENGQVLCIDTINIRQLINERINEFSLITQNKKMYIVADNNIIIEGDRLFLTLMIDNLIKNALHYCHSQILITINELNDQHIQIQIEDDGPGIVLDKIEQIFAPFSRLDASRNRDSGGYGLGLAIVKSVITRHQGEISISTGQLKGANFIVLLPYKQVPYNQPPNQL